MRQARIQITTRAMAVAMFWLGVCLALWTTSGALETGYPLLAGWLALCVGIAALFGVALKFVRAVAVILPLSVVGILLVAGLTRFIPEGPAILVVGTAVWVLVGAWRGYARRRISPPQARGISRRGTSVERPVE
jgi:hypothetical protein